MAEDDENSGFKMKVFKMANRLKVKMGLDPKDETPGFIAPEAIEEADRLIEALCEECSTTISGHLENLATLWKNMRDMEETPAREKLASEIFTVAHEIKDIGAMCGYNLVAHFAESLRDYIGETELNLTAQRVIIQAHLDAMQTVHRNGLKDDAGPVAEELKKAVKIAIDKYR